MTDRCPTCDQPEATGGEPDWLTNAKCWRVWLCTHVANADCEANRVDWRARWAETHDALGVAMSDVGELVRERDRLLERVGIADGLYAAGQEMREVERNEQRAARERLIEERDRLRAFVETVAEFRMFGLFGKNEDMQATIRQQAQRVLRGESET